jgi:hypothetical protein
MLMSGLYYTNSSCRYFGIVKLAPWYHRYTPHLFRCLHCHNYLSHGNSTWYSLMALCCSHNNSLLNTFLRSNLISHSLCTDMFTYSSPLPSLSRLPFIYSKNHTSFTHTVMLLLLLDSSYLDCTHNLSHSFFLLHPLHRDIRYVFILYYLLLLLRLYNSFTHLYNLLRLSNYT